MKGNRISRDDTKAWVMATGLMQGLQSLETELAITGASAAEFRNLIAACTAAETDVGVAKAEKQAASITLQTADDAARAYLNKAKAALAASLGPRWHSGWEPTGFPAQCTMIPKRQTARWNLCARLQTYFGDHPAREIPASGTTAAKAGENYEAIRRAQSALLCATTALDQKLKARDALYLKLRRTIRSAMNYIGNAMPPDDPRWRTFGLNAPADPHVPERVAELNLKQKGPDSLEVSWTKAPRATRYRIYVQVVGKDAAPRARPPAYDPRAILTGFASGDVVRIHILAANATGQAAPSPTAEITMA